MNGAMDRGVYRLPVLRFGLGVLIYNEPLFRVFVNAIHVFYMIASCFVEGFLLLAINLLVHV